jgi:aspartyl-tRNA synthetase
MSECVISEFVVGPKPGRGEIIVSVWKRSVACGDVSEALIGQTVTLNGWVNRTRDHRGIVFIDVRDRTGIVQVAVDSGVVPDIAAQAERVRSEYCLSIIGTVRRRPEGMENDKIASGNVEVAATALDILNPSKTPPFPIAEEKDSNINEMLRLKYRYLDLRRPAMFEKMRLRHEAIRLIREFMYGRGFLEIETPILTKSSPEGARDYLVPYRLEPGLFYALPQAPQQFKQLLMVAGIERYFQIAKCFRDESQRADRQPEFTQLDLEMSFVEQDDVLEVVESLYSEIIPKISPKTMVTPFTRLTYDESMARFGTDKPDLRYGLELKDAAPVLKNTQFSVFQSVLNSGNQVKLIRYPQGASLSRKEIDDLTAMVKETGAKGLAYLLVTEDGVKSPIAKFLTDDEISGLVALAEAVPGDLVGFVADTPEIVAKALDLLRREIAKRQSLADPNTLHFAWVTDFPVFEWDDDSKGWTFAHNPFAMPHAEHLDILESDPAACRAYTYDLVCNGSEGASGSIRIHKRDIQERIFRMLGKTDEQIQDQFGHMLEAFDFGAPPHGGMAPGIDRLIMYLTDDDNVREVIAFPKSGGGFDPMMDAPSEVEDKQLRELGITVKRPPKKEEKQ